ncbi:MAG: YihY/virulence factor BrkB family protein [Oscillospiraceae bacterium]|nr:YihY/virulence factor BrkB family protein [Oscillospiraceae bacterium]
MTRPQKLQKIVETTVGIALDHNIMRSAAALSYFLTLTLFPLLICLYNMLGTLFPAYGTIREFLSGLLPEETTNTILDFLNYVAANTSTMMLAVALTVMVTSSSAAYRVIHDVMSDMRGRPRFEGLGELVFSVLFSVIFLAAMYFSVLLIMTGQRVLQFIDRHVMFMNLSDTWAWGRFAVLFLLLYVLMSLIYRFTAPRHSPSRQMPGAVFASLALMAVSVVFALIIGQSFRYPLVYGSLASVILMMFWFYACGTVMFLGNALNVALERLSE